MIIGELAPISLSKKQMTCPFFHFPDPAVGEQVTGDDFGEDRPDPVSVLGDPGHQLVEDDFIVPFQRSPERIGHEPFGQVPRQVGLPAGQEALQVRRVGEGGPGWERSCRIDRAPGFIPVPPSTDGVEVLQGPR